VLNIGTGGTAGGPTPYQQASLDIRKESANFAKLEKADKAATLRIKDNVLDTEAFKLQVTNTEDMDDKQKEAAELSDDRWNANQPAAEAAAARAYENIEDYVAAGGPMPEVKKEKRRTVWRDSNSIGKSATPATTGAVSSIPGL